MDDAELTRLDDIVLTVEALTASVGATRADLEILRSLTRTAFVADIQALKERVAALETHAPLHARDHEILKERLDGLKREWDPREALQVMTERMERNAVERDRALYNLTDCERVLAEVRAARTEDVQELTTLRAILQRVRRGDLVRCLTCQGAGQCADCCDDHGNGVFGCPGLITPEANR